MPQLAQGFLPPHARGRTSKPQRLQSLAGGGGEAGTRGRPPTLDLLKAVDPGEERVRGPLDADGGVRSMAAVHDGAVGEGQKLPFN